MSPTTSSVAQNLFYAQNQFIDITYIQNLSTFFKYYNILFRPPYGSYKQEELAAIAKKLNYKIVLWTTVDARDWQNPAAEVIANKIINNAKNGDIILLHDLHSEFIHIF